MYVGLREYVILVKYQVPTCYRRVLNLDPLAWKSIASHSPIYWRTPNKAQNKITIQLHYKWLRNKKDPFPATRN